MNAGETAHTELDGDGAATPVVTSAAALRARDRALHAPAIAAAAATRADRLERLLLQAVDDLTAERRRHELAISAAHTARAEAETRAAAAEARAASAELELVQATSLRGRLSHIRRAVRRQFNGAGAGKQSDQP